MYAARDYLELRHAEAVAQWQSILARPAPTAGRRQAPFTPVETLLCLAASLEVNHRDYGSSNRHQAAEPVPSLARLFRRSTSSILYKMANLDGTQANSARHEVEVAGRLLSAPERLADIYRTILRSARQSGVGFDELPDFLGLENAGALELLGQEKLTAAGFEIAVEQDAERWHIAHPDVDIGTTERLMLARARVGQHRFANGVLRNHGYRCVFCGLTLATVSGLPMGRMLIASHIKPWRASAPTERLDVRNGLAACPTHDAAFDTGLLAVTGDLRIHLAAELARSARVDPASRAAFGRPPLAERLLLPAGAMPPGPRYLAWHHEKVYRDTPLQAGIRSR